jgi:hypothetical protein
MTNKEQERKPLTDSEKILLRRIMPAIIDILRKKDKAKNQGLPNESLAPRKHFNDYPPRWFSNSSIYIEGSTSVAIHMLYDALDQDVAQGKLDAALASAIKASVTIDDTFYHKMRKGIELSADYTLLSPEDPRYNPFPLKDIFIEFAQKHGLSEEGLQVLGDKMDVIGKEAQRYREIAAKIARSGLLKGWERGRFTHEQPVFASKDDLDLFFRHLPDKFYDYFGMNKVKESAVVESAMATLKERLSDYEQSLAGKQAEHMARRAARDAEIAEKVARKASRASHPAVPTWKLGPKNTLIIFDASALKNLRARRTNRRSWLDMVQQMAELPHIRVVVPAFIADTELQGKIAKYDEQGNCISFDRIRPPHPDEHIFSEFFADAARATLHPDGTVTYHPGKNKNFIIVNTPGLETEKGKNLDQLLQKIAAQPPEQRSISLANEIHQKGYGERAINYIVTHSPFVNRIMIVSDDIAYLDNRAYPTSSKGMPVGAVSTGSYLEAEIKCREKDLRHKLKETQKITMDRLRNDIAAFKKFSANSQSVEIFGYEKPGMYKDNDKEEHGRPHFGEDMQHIIQRAVEEQHKRDAHAEENKKHPFAKEDIGPRLLDPETIRKNKGKGFKRGA